MCTYRLRRVRPRASADDRAVSGLLAIGRILATRVVIGGQYNAGRNEGFVMPDSIDRYRMPPEWAPHQGTWLSWPHNRETWPGCLAEAETALTQAVVALADGETVHINVLDDAHRAVVAKRFDASVAPERIRFHVIPTNDAWCRDHGAIFAFDAADELVALDFRFNAWGEKYGPYDADDAAARADG